MYLPVPWLGCFYMVGVFGPGVQFAMTVRATEWNLYKNLENCVLKLLMLNWAVLCFVFQPVRIVDKLCFTRSVGANTPQSVLFCGCLWDGLLPAASFIHLEKLCWTVVKMWNVDVECFSVEAFTVIIWRSLSCLGENWGSWSVVFPLACGASWSLVFLCKVG